IRFPFLLVQVKAGCLFDEDDVCAGIGNFEAACLTDMALEKDWIYKTPSRSAIVFSGEDRGDSV
ncbi:MAG: hypothetical protein II175_03275, partial [Schwartzia sp.]|nr:hypothetical protein [Schwartzia sp. (in: firmicutes)]